MPGQTIGNRYDDSHGRDGLEAGTPVETAVMRDGWRMTVPIPHGGGE